MTVGQRLRRWWAQVDGLARMVWPREAEDFLARGLDRHLKGDLAGAMADYDRAIAGYPDRQSRAMADLMRGNVRREQDELAGAIAEYDRSIALHPARSIETSKAEAVMLIRIVHLRDDHSHLDKPAAQVIALG